MSLYDGGRQVTISSCFELLNKTTHNIQLASHPNQLHLKRGKNKNYHGKESPDTDDMIDFRLDECNIEILNPGETIQVPFTLLESSLHNKGRNLGSFWLRPFEREDFIAWLDVPGLNANDASIGFCSNPIQLVQLVEDSAMMFSESGGNVSGCESFSSGYQLSCPIMEKKEENVSPFCYCIEVRRSPLVAPFAGHDVSTTALHNASSQEAKDTSTIKSDSMMDEKSESFSHISNISKSIHIGRDGKKPKHSRSPLDLVHGPVAYSLEIHPPIVIENLLPEKARYELMHATRKQVVWSSDLMPGESVPVYTVGLDAPLLLLIHLGYCRTPVGEGVSEIFRTLFCNSCSDLIDHLI